MKHTPTPKAPPRLTLRADTAADLMTPSPVSIPQGAPLQEAVMLFTDRGISAAPVIDEAGRPVGVISNTDVVTHDREKVNYLPAGRARAGEEVTTEVGEHLRTGFQVVDVDRTQVRDVMTPAVFSVAPEAPAAKVVEQLLALNVHRLFVVDRDGVLVGVISTVDILRKLLP
jgi:CBS-domain-containing membrane protein